MRDVANEIEKRKRSTSVVAHSPTHPPRPAHIDACEKLRRLFGSALRAVIDCRTRVEKKVFPHFSFSLTQFFHRRSSELKASIIYKI